MSDRSPGREPTERRHWLVTSKSRGLSITVYSEEQAALYDNRHWTVAGPFVPVAEVERLREALRLAAESCERDRYGI
jgi:hypothetical protein